MSSQMTANAILYFKIVACVVVPCLFVIYKWVLN